MSQLSKILKSLSVFAELVSLLCESTVNNHSTRTGDTNHKGTQVKGQQPPGHQCQLFIQTRQNYIQQYKHRYYTVQLSHQKETLFIEVICISFVLF